VRSNIEEWCRRDLVNTGCEQKSLTSMEYFDVYLRYWEQYYLSMVTNGMSASRDLRILAYGKETFESLARTYHRDFGSLRAASEFQVSGNVGQRHPDWVARAQPSIERVAAAWRLVGLSFPMDEIATCA
jgi:hypothetical protein